MDLPKGYKRRQIIVYAYGATDEYVKHDYEAIKKAIMNYEGRDVSLSEIEETYEGNGMWSHVEITKIC